MFGLRVWQLLGLLLVRSRKYARASGPSGFRVSGFQGFRVQGLGFRV